MKSNQVTTKKGKLALVDMDSNKTIELSQEQARWFLPYLQQFIETGSIKGSAGCFSVEKIEELDKWTEEQIEKASRK